MPKLLEIYKCDLCGNIVQLVHEGGGQLVCCGQPMKLVKENTVEAAKEKHIPVIEKVPGGYLVKVGSVAHPMEAKHYIEWIEIQFENRDGRCFLKPGDKPEAIFLGIEGKVISARAYCNLHGLWKS